MKNTFLCVTVMIFVSSLVSAQTTYTSMWFSQEEMLEWQNEINNAPLAYLDPGFLPQTGHFDLLEHLAIYPHRQGNCGVCWAFAGNSCLGIALHVETGILDDLSVQYINSCRDDECCAGGTLERFCTFYTNTGQAIPSSNLNANWQDQFEECNLECFMIGTNPNYPISSISGETILTHDVGSEQAIENIKNVLEQNKAIWFSVTWNSNELKSDFETFFNGGPENALWNQDSTCGQSIPSYGGFGHAMLCVGYDDENPDDRYWIILNSWGQSPGHPDGLLRFNMDMNYDCKYILPNGGSSYAFNWQTLNVTFDDSLYPTPTPTTIPTFTPVPTATPTTVPKPQIFFGGYLDSYVVTHPDEICVRTNAFMYVEKFNHSIAQAGLTELPTDPWAQPNIILGFSPVQGAESYYSFSDAFTAPIHEPPGDLIYGMAATDGGSNYTHHWPYLPIRNNGSNNPGDSAAFRDSLVHIPDAVPNPDTLSIIQTSINILQNQGAGPGEKPIIWAAGYFNTDLVVGEPGILQIGAMVTADQYENEIDRIDVFDRYGTQIVHLDGPGTLHEGFYWFYQQWTFAETPSLSDALLRMQVVNTNGVKSDNWPIIDKHSANEVAPVITGITSLDGSCRVTWTQTNAIEIDHFKVGWTDLENSLTGVSGEIPYNQLSYVITGLTDCHRHNIRVTAFDLCGKSLQSASVQGKPSQQPIPQNVRITVNSVKKDFIIVWDETSTGIYGVFESLYSDMRNPSLICFCTVNSAFQPEFHGIVKYFAVRSCVSTRVEDLDLAGCLSVSVRGRQWPVNEVLARNLTLLDVNNDGIDDLILISADQTLKIYLGQADGSWSLPSQSFPSPVKDYTVFDFNKDGSVDIALAKSGEVLTYFNDGSGSMSITESLFPPGQNKVITSDDLDNKGASDVVVGNSSGTLVKSNDASGQTQEIQQLDSGDTKVVVATDLDGDGKKDLITASETGETVIWKKNETGQYVDSGQAIQTWGTESLKTEDVNHDGCIDLIVTDNTGYEVVFINDCAGNFTAQ